MSDGLTVFDAPDILWCSSLWNSLKEEGVWGVPRSGLTFQKKDGKLLLVERLPNPEAKGWDDYQQEDYDAIKSRFEAAGITVEEGDLLPDNKHLPTYVVGDIGDEPWRAF